MSTMSKEAEQRLMDLCIDELRLALATARREPKTPMEIVEVPLDRHGYGEGDQCYFGVGLPVFCVSWTTHHGNAWWHHVRAPNYSALQDALVLRGIIPPPACPHEVAFGCWEPTERRCGEGCNCDCHRAAKDRP